ncbi:MAG: efflux RND transporter permease subunit [Nitrospiraceae bacterium]
MAITLKYPWVSVAAVLVMIAALGYGAGGLRVNASYDAYFDTNDPLLAVNKDLADKYASADSVIVILESVKHDMLVPAHYAVIDRIKSAGQALPFVKRVSSIADFVDLHPEIDASTKSVFLHLNRDRVLSDEYVRRLLVSGDGRFALIEITFTLPGDGKAEVLLNTMAQLRAFIEQEINLAQVPIIAHYTGTLALKEAYVLVIRHDLKLFLPVLILLFLVTLWGLFSSLWVAISIFLNALLAVVGAFGAAGWLKFELASIAVYVPVIIASIAIAGAVHFTTSYLHNRADGQTPMESVRHALTLNLLPLALTSFTTIAGFLGLAFSPSPPVRTVGYIVAFGIALSFLLTVTLLPVLLCRVKVNPGLDLRAVFQIPWLIRFITANSRSILVWFTLVAVLSVAGVFGNEINDNVFEYFPDSHEFRQDTRLIDEEFSGVNTISYSLETGQRYGIFQQVFLEKMDAFSRWLRAQPEVNRVVTIADLPRIRHVVGVRDPSSLMRYRRIAEDNTPAALSLQHHVSEDYSALHAAVYLKNLDARSMIAFDDRVRTWLDRQFTPFSYQGGAGANLTFAHLGQRNAASMVYSLGLALVAIALIAGLILRSVTAAWIGVLCNVVPVLTAYALWALVDGKIALGGAVVLGMILGVIVDDTIYLLARYRRLNQMQSDLVIPAILNQVGPALIITTMTLSMGLLIGLLSDFAPILAMSSLSVAIILLALAADLLVLPALLQLSYSIQPPSANSVVRAS